MKFVLFVFGGLIAVVVLCVAVGFARPKGHVAASSIEVTTSPYEVWDVLSDFGSWPAWNSEIQHMERGEDRNGKAFWVAKGKFGEMPWVVDVLEEPTRIVTRIPEDASARMSGGWTFELEETEEEGTRLTLTERGEVGNPLFRFFLIFHDNYATQRAFLTDLGARLNEDVAIETVATE